MEFIKKNLLAIIVAGAAVLALIFGLILPGAVLEEHGAEISFSVLGLAFGGAEYKVSVGGATITEKLGDGGMSIFGLISLVALIVGIVLIVMSMFKDGKLGFIGSILIAVAGVCMLLLLVAGTEISSGAYTQSFAKTFEQFKLGAGAIIYAIIAILGGGFGILNKYKKIV